MDARMQVKWGELVAITTWCRGHVNCSDGIGTPQMFVQIPVNGLKYASEGRAYLGDWIVKKDDEFYVERQCRIKEG